MSCKTFKCSQSLSLSLQVCTAKMNLSDEVDLEDYVSRPDKISAAEVSLFILQALDSIAILFTTYLVLYKAKYCLIYHPLLYLLAMKAKFQFVSFLATYKLVRTSRTGCGF